MPISDKRQISAIISGNIPKIILSKKGAVIILQGKRKTTTDLL
jgi:hypothetical protein